MVAQRLIAPGTGQACTPCGGRLDDEPQLGPLVLLGQRVALHRGGEAALRRQRELLEGDVPAGLIDAPLKVVPGLQLWPLRRDQAEHHDLAGRDEPQRLEAAGAGVVELQKEPVDLQLGEQRLGDVAASTPTCST